MDTHYSVLNVSPQATLKDIEKAYKREALQWHPDRKPEAEKAAATERFQRMAEAYQVLKDEQSRKVYDHSLLTQPSAPSHETSTAPPPHRPSFSMRRTASGMPSAAASSPPRRDSYSRQASRSPPSTSPPHSSHQSFAPPPSSFRPPPPTSSSSQHRRRPVDPFKIFDEAWGGRSLKDIINEIQFAYNDPDGWRAKKRGSVGGGMASGGKAAGGESQSWDENDWRDHRRGGPTPAYGDGQTYTPMERFERSHTRQSGPSLGGVAGNAAGTTARPRSKSVLGTRGADGSVNPVSEIQLTTFRVERLANGSVHMSREMKSQTIGDDGMVHVRHRRQNTGLDYDHGSDPTRATYTDRPPLKILTSAAAGVRPGFSRRESPTAATAPSSFERPRSAYGSRSSSGVAVGSAGMMSSNPPSRQGSFSAYPPCPTSDPPRPASHLHSHQQHVPLHHSGLATSSVLTSTSPERRRSGPPPPSTLPNLQRASSGTRLPSVAPPMMPTYNGPPLHTGSSGGGAPNTIPMPMMTRSGSVGPGAMPSVLGAGYNRARARSLSRRPVMVASGYDPGYF